mgnify:CR=1 FL=1
MVIMGMTIPMTVTWGVLAVVFAILEAATVGLTSIWFCGGAVVAGLLAMFVDSIPVQIGAFVIVSIILMFAARPIIKEKLKVGTTETNANSLLGTVVIVTREINPLVPGEVKAGGLIWMATSDAPIPEGALVKIKKIDGVKLVVKEEK